MQASKVTANGLPCINFSTSSVLSSFIQGKENKAPTTTASSPASESTGIQAPSTPAEMIVPTRPTSMSAIQNNENVFISN